MLICIIYNIKETASRCMALGGGVLNVFETLLSLSSLQLQALFPLSHSLWSEHSRASRKWKSGSAPLYTSPLTEMTALCPSSPPLSHTLSLLPLSLSASDVLERACLTPLAQLSLCSSSFPLSSLSLTSLLTLSHLLSLSLSSLPLLSFSLSASPTLHSAHRDLQIDEGVRTSHHSLHHLQVKCSASPHLTSASLRSLTLNQALLSRLSLCRYLPSLSALFHLSLISLSAPLSLSNALFLSLCLSALSHLSPLLSLLSPLLPSLPLGSLLSASPALSSPPLLESSLALTSLSALCFGNTLKRRHRLFPLSATPPLSPPHPPGVCTSFLSPHLSCTSFLPSSGSRTFSS